MKYRPSWHFVSALGLLSLSFFIMQKAVVPNIIANGMSAQVASFSAPKVISKAQTKLTELGLYDGKINSRLNLETKIALTKFQKENNLKQSGLLDAPTQKALLGIDLYPEKNPNLVSGTLRKLEWEEFDEKSKKITTKELDWYLEKTDGTTVSIDKRFVDRDLVNQNVSYNTKTNEFAWVSGDEEGDPKSDFQTNSSQVKTLVFLAQFANSTPVPHTAAQYRNLIFGSDSQLQTLQSAQGGYVTKFYKEMTHDQVNISGDVYGWYQFPGNGTEYNNFQFEYCYISNENIQTMADYYGADIGNYDRVITISNCEEYNNLGGTAFPIGWVLPTIRTIGHFDRLGFEQTTNVYGPFPGIVWNLIHELGHTFNLFVHSSSLDCGTRTISYDCSYQNQGNPFDAMGHWDGRVFNFNQQERAEWIGEDNILNITESGNYRLEALQTSGGVVGAKISVPGVSNPVFALEHRKVSGFDSLPHFQASNLADGLLLYAGISQNQMTWPQVDYNVYNLVDPHPTDLPIFEDLIDAITIANPFYDEHFGIYISINSVDRAGINFSVSYDYDNSICGQQALNPGPISNPLCNIPGGVAVENFSGVIQSPSQVNLTWTNIDADATALTIERATDSSFLNNRVTLTNALSSDETSYSVIDLPSEPQLYFRIRATNTNGGSLWTSLGPINMADFPPSGLSAVTISSSQIDLSWTDNSENETNFYLQRSTNQNFSGMVTTSPNIPTNPDNWSVGYLSPNTTYFFRIRASLGSGFSPWSNTATATTLP